MNRKILVIDDEESILESFRFALVGDQKEESVSADAATALFGDSEGTKPQLQASSNRFELDVDFASDGKEGVFNVQQAIESGSPYAVIFCDMRMPGLDGLQTIEQIRNLDPHCEVFFVTAYSDYSVDTISERVGSNVGYFLKPFANEEILQIATKSVLDWNRSRELEKLVEVVSDLGGERRQIESVEHSILEQMRELLEIADAAVLRAVSPSSFEFRVGIGKYESGCEDSVLQQLQIEDLKHQRICESGNQVVMPIGRYGAVVCEMNGDTNIAPDRRYLVQILLEQAGLAIEKSEALQNLRQQDRMSAVGSALKYVVNDLKEPLESAQELLRQAVGDPLSRNKKQRVDQYLPTLLSECSDLLRDVLSYSQGENIIERRKFGLSKILGLTFSPLRRELAKQSIDLNVEVPDSFELLVDAPRFCRCLRNIVLSLATFDSGSDNRQILVKATDSEGSVVISISDSGMGIPDSLVENFFEPFAVHDSGFGLAIAKQIIEGHHGTVAIESHESATTLTIELSDAGEDCSPTRSAA